MQQQNMPSASTTASTTQQQNKIHTLRHMGKILGLALLVPVALWLLTNLSALLAKPEFWEFRRAAVLLSGILTLVWMSLTMILALRTPWIEQKLGGLDRLYALHKNLGIGAGILLLIHFLAEWGVKQFAIMGLLPPRVRGAKGVPVESLWMTLKDAAKFVGEWAGYIAAALIVIALWRRFSYRTFRLSHKIFPLIFIAGTYHGLLLMPTNYWTSPIAWLVASLAAAGIVSALYSLSGKLGSKQRHDATVSQIESKADGVLAVTLQPAATWPGQKSGQFLLVDFGTPWEGAHPFTIASAWQAGGSITLAIKALGDYTKRLANIVAVGQKVRIEGPYGGLTFHDDDRQQIWVAGGIGVTPFIARLQELAGQAASKTGQQKRHIDFFYSRQNQNGEHFPSDLEKLCAAAGVTLHAWYTDSQGYLPHPTIGEKISDISRCSVYFCGPYAWGEALKNHLLNKGLPETSFEREKFEFR